MKTRTYAALSATTALEPFGINQAFERVIRSDVRHRFVIDNASLG